jgi:hypothetical protein
MANWKLTRKQVYERDKATCQVCGRQLNWNIYECGHVVDRVAGGSDALANLVAMCLICNRLKPIHETEEEFNEWCKQDVSTMLSNPMRQGIKRSFQDLAKNGYAVGGKAPKGYLAKREQTGSKRRGKPQYGVVWIPDPEKFSLAQRAWEMRANGVTYSEIHAAIPSFYSQLRCWAGFFANKSYLGIRKCGDLEVPDAHPAIVTQEQWDKVQAMRGRKSGGAYPRRVSSPFLLSGLLICAYCGNLMSGSSGGDWKYYVCSRKTRDGWHTCEAHSIGANKVDKAVAHAILDDPADSDTRKQQIILRRLVDHIVIDEKGGKIYYRSPLEVPRIQTVSF